MGWDDTLRGELHRSFSGLVLFDEPAAAHTSIRVGGKIDALVFPEDINELKAVLEFLRLRGIPFLPVGNWTNLIVRDGGFRGAFICLTRLRKQVVKYQGEKGAFVFAQAGCPLAELVKTAAENSLSGAEFCAGIPGSVGGAIRMNAGAYGGEIKDITEEIRMMDTSGTVRTVAAKELPFAYRNLDLPANSIIIEAVFRLPSGRKEDISKRIAEIIKARTEKHPLELPNAGSIFKNPADYPAGRLIEECGLKESRIGAAEVSGKHANFIVNRGAATAEEIIVLIAAIKESVFQKTGRTLETEVKVVGES
jgi:UDP-N-acetylmuramate dehydrogenase